jgi:hypothetical protein
VQVEAWVGDVVAPLLDAHQAVPLFELVSALEAGPALDRRAATRLYATLREQGYLRRAAVAASWLEADPAAETNRRADVVEGELRVLRGEARPEVPRIAALDKELGRVLHVVGTSLPDVESSYTRRTHAAVLRERELGLEPAVVTQMGVGEPDGYRVDEIDGVRYHRVPGPGRSSLPLDEWFELHVVRLAAVVRKVRPAALVAASDFLNGMAAQAVSEAYGIPFVYDVRGFWEDSWMERRRETYGWPDDDLLASRWGLPDTVLLRREREAELVRSAAGVYAATAALGSRAVALGADAEVVTDLAVDGHLLVRVLERLGVVDRGSESIALLESSHPSAADVRRLLGDRERRPLERTAVTGVKGSSRALRERGWVLGSLPAVDLSLPMDWPTLCPNHRSQNFHLHAWDFMVPFLNEYATSGARELLTWCLERAVSWCETFTTGDDRGTMAWYDMALALRSPRLAYLLHEAVHIGADDVTLETLARGVVRHQREIFAPRSFTPRTNHGFYTAVGQLSFARRLQPLPGMDAVMRQGESRLQQVAARQFAADGGHLEQAPDYHRMLLESFLDAVDDGLVHDPEVVRRLERAGEVMGWFLRPDGTVVQIGDSPATLVPAEARVAQSPHTAFLASRGARGEPNPERLLVLPESGYAIVRAPQPQGTSDHLDASYLTLMAAFHSRTHKHADDLSITWFDGGTELLIDPGRYGYLDQLPADSPQREEGFFYARPERQYVERTRSHNTVEVDGRDHNRRYRRPYGSALVSAQEREDHFQVVGRVDHGHWTHERRVVLAPGRWLLVIDAVEASDDAEHDIRVWWNLPEALSDPERGDGVVSFQLPTGDDRIWVETLDGAGIVTPVCGATDPLRGWRSTVDYSFTPAWSMATEMLGVRAHTFVTLLSLGPAAHGGVPPHPFGRAA